VFGDPNSVETYEGGRDYDSVSAFAKENISKLFCSVFKKIHCSDDELKIIESIETQSDEQLLALAENVDTLVKREEETFDAEVEKIQQKYDSVVADFNLQLDTIKEKFNYQFLEQIINIREIAAGEEEEGEGEEEGEL
jgi:hypothetical protein